MIYPYRCKSCDFDYEVIKSVRQIDELENCPKCGDPTERYIGRPNLNQVCDWVETYNPAFGTVIKSKRHQREILKRYADKGVHFEEVGNEPVENIHKHFDRERAAKREQRWRDADRIMAYEDSY